MIAFIGNAIVLHKRRRKKKLLYPGYPFQENHPFFLRRIYTAFRCKLHFYHLQKMLKPVLCFWQGTGLFHNSPTACAPNKDTQNGKICMSLLSLVVRSEKCSIVNLLHFSFPLLKMSPYKALAHKIMFISPKLRNILQLIFVLSGYRY